jgi:adenylate kinase family enzyme
MLIKLFLLGRPCSGKTTAARHFARLAESKGWFPKHVSDYKFLNHLFQEEEKLVQQAKLLPADLSRRFKPAKGEEQDMRRGFDVIDFSVLDEVLGSVERKIRRKIEKHQSKPQFLVTAEFARNDYAHAFQQFEPDFLQQTYFIFISTSVETCIERIKAGKNKAGSKRNHLVSEDIMRRYYAPDCKPYFQSELSNDFSVPQEHIKIIDNEMSEGKFLDELWRYVETILVQAAVEPATVATRITRKLDID